MSLGSLSVRTRRGWKAQGICACVGGPSVFYGGASFRYREADFQPSPEIVGSSEARWPLSYGELEPFYGWAETLLGVAGEAGSDPTEPFRSNPFPQTPPRPQPQDGAKLEAQRAFFAAIAGKSQAAPAAPQAPQSVAAPTASEPVVRTAASSAEPPQKILRPGSILDIRV